MTCPLPMQKEPLSHSDVQRTKQPRDYGAFTYTSDEARKAPRPPTLTIQPATSPGLNITSQCSELLGLVMCDRAFMYAYIAMVIRQDLRSLG